MVILELDIAAVGFEELLGRHEQAEVFVEGEFLAGKRVDKWADQFEETPEEPGDYNDGDDDG